MIGRPPNADLGSVRRYLHHLVAAHLLRVAGGGKAASNPVGHFRGYAVALPQQMIVAIGQAVVTSQARIMVLPDQPALPVQLPDVVGSWRVAPRISEKQVPVVQEETVRDAARVAPT